MFGLDVKWTAELLARTAVAYRDAYVGLDRASLIERLQRDYPGSFLSIKDDFWSFPLVDIPFKCALSAIGKEPSSVMITGQERYGGFALHIGKDFSFSSAKETPFEGGPTRKAVQLCKKLENFGIRDMTDRL